MAKTIEHSGAAAQPAKPPPVEAPPPATQVTQHDATAARVALDIQNARDAMDAAPVDPPWKNGPPAKLFGIGQWKFVPPSGKPPYRSLTRLKIGEGQYIERGKEISDPVALKLVEGLHYECAGA